MGRGRRWMHDYAQADSDPSGAELYEAHEQWMIRVSDDLLLPLHIPRRN